MDERSGWAMPQGSQQRRRRAAPIPGDHPGDESDRGADVVEVPTRMARSHASALDSGRHFFDDPGRPAAPLPTLGPEAAPHRHAPSALSSGEIFRLLRRRILSLLACLLICLVAAFGLLQAAAKSYEANSAVRVAPVTASGDSETANDISTITESRIVTSTAVAARAARTLHYTGSLSSLLGHVEVSSPLSSQLIYITYTSASPQKAADGANAFARAYLSYSKSVGEANLSDQAAKLTEKIKAIQTQLGELPKGASAEQRDALQSQIVSLNNRLSANNTEVVVPGQVVGVAQTPSAPSSPKKIIYLAAGLLFGLIVGIVVAVVRDRRDDSVHGPDDLADAVGAPVLASIAARERGSDPVLVIGSSPDAARTQIDAYRTAATKLRTPVTGKGSSSFLLARGGRVAEREAPLNLAAMFARQGLQTALVTTDQGLAQLAPLFDEGSLPDSLDEGLTPVPSVANLWVLSLGAEDEMDTIIGGRTNLIEDILNLVDVALLDGVNLELRSSLLTLGRLTGAAVVVAVDGRTTHTELESAMRELDQVGTSALGGLLYVRRRRLLGRRRG